MDWNGVRVLVTGADGFMGSHLTESLLNKGAEVSVYVRGTTETTVKYKLKNIQHVESKLKAVLTGIAAEKRTSIAFEAPHRLRATLELASRALENQRIAVCRELTKKFEEVRREPVSMLIKHFTRNKPLGEFVICLKVK